MKDTAARLDAKRYGGDKVRYENGNFITAHAHAVGQASFGL